MANYRIVLEKNLGEYNLSFTGSKMIDEFADDSSVTDLIELRDECKALIPMLDRKIEEAARNSEFTHSQPVEVFIV